MQDRTATTRHGVTRKEAQKKLQDTENLFRKNLELTLLGLGGGGCRFGPPVSNFFRYLLNY